MAPKFNYPIQEEWMTTEEYEEAVESYENAVDDYYSQHYERY